MYWVNPVIAWTLVREESCFRAADASKPGRAYAGVGAPGFGATGVAPGTVMVPVAWLDIGVDSSRSMETSPAPGDWVVVNSSAASLNSRSSVVIWPRPLGSRRASTVVVSTVAVPTASSSTKPSTSLNFGIGTCSPTESGLPPSVQAWVVSVELPTTAKRRSATSLGS